MPPLLFLFLWNGQQRIHIPVSYTHLYPFAAFITNLGKYNEGELVGEWVKFPTTAEELKEVFKRIGIGQKDDFDQPYEEWFITDYDCYVDGLYSKLGEYENLDELNYLASKLDEMSESEYAQFQAGMETVSYTHLDVYKRQGLHHGRGNAFPVCGLYGNAGKPGRFVPRLRLCRQVHQTMF